MYYLKQERWSPYVAGILIGILSVGSLLIFNKTIGISTTFSKGAALLWSIVNYDHFASNAYYISLLKNKAWIDWQLMLVIGVFIGSYLSRRLSKSSTGALIPGSFSWRPFIGGLIVMFGARFAGGCTSGHAITGGVQLALSGWLFMIGVFAMGIPTAFIFYQKKYGALS